MAAVIICNDFEPKKIKSLSVSIISPSIFHEVMGLDAMILVFWMLSIRPTCSLYSFTFIKRLFSSSLSAIRVVSSAYLRLLTFLPAILIPACSFLVYWTPYYADWFQIGKWVHQGCILSPCLFNLYAEYIMRNAGLEEAQAGMKIAGRNINNLNMQMIPPLWQKAKKN